MAVTLLLGGVHVAGRVEMRCRPAQVKCGSRTNGNQAGASVRFRSHSVRGFSVGFRFKGWRRRLRAIKTGPSSIAYSHLSQEETL